MARNKYDLHAEIITRKYAKILQSFQEADDDRRIAWNCYQQLLTACGAMTACGMENNFVCCAVNEKIREQEAEIDSIITRFTGLEYRDYEWTEPLGSGVYFEVYRESPTEGGEDTRLKSTRDGESAFKLARECEEVTGAEHYVVIVTPAGQRIKTNDF